MCVVCLRNARAKPVVVYILQLEERFSLNKGLFHTQKQKQRTRFILTLRRYCFKNSEFDSAPKRSGDVMGHFFFFVGLIPTQMTHLTQTTQMAHLTQMTHLTHVTQTTHLTHLTYFSRREPLLLR